MGGVVTPSPSVSKLSVGSSGKTSMLSSRRSLSVSEHSVTVVAVPVQVAMTPSESYVESQPAGQAAVPSVPAFRSHIRSAVVVSSPHQ
jgi:hypothetical protein